MLGAPWRKLLHKCYAVGELWEVYLPGSTRLRFPNSREETPRLLPQNHMQHKEKDRGMEKRILRVFWMIALDPSYKCSSQEISLLASSCFSFLRMFFLICLSIVLDSRYGHETTAQSFLCGKARVVIYSIQLTIPLPAMTVLTLFLHHSWEENTSLQLLPCGGKETAGPSLLRPDPSTGNAGSLKVFKEWWHMVLYLFSQQS